MSQTLDEPTAPPLPSPSRNPFGLGFLPATPDDLQSSPLPSPSTSPESPPPPAEESDSAGEWDDAPPPESPEDTSSPGSIPASELLPPEGLRDVFRGGVIIAGDQAHNFLARTPGQQTAGLYRTDEDDAESIGDPLARIAARHAGVGKVNPDTADLLAAMMGLTRYASKQIIRTQTARALDTAAQSSPQATPGGQS